MKNRWYLVGLICLCSGLSIAGQRYATVDWHKSQVPVVDRSQTQWQTALHHAFAQALVRGTGTYAALQWISEKQWAMRAKQSLLQYRYVEPKAPGQALQLAFEFDRDQISQWIEKAGYAVWPPKRPVMMVWLAVDDQPESLEGALDELHSLFEKAAQTIGLPMEFPMIDMEEIVQLSAKDMLLTNQMLLHRLSQRYQSHTVLIGTLTHRLTEGYWVGQWGLLLNKQIKQWQSTHADLEGLIEQAIAVSAKKLIKAEQKRQLAQVVLVKVQAIERSEDSHRVLTYLQALAGVESAEIEILQPTVVHYRLWYRGKEEDLYQDLSISPLLRAVSNQSGSDQLLFEYQP